MAMTLAPFILGNIKRRTTIYTNPTPQNQARKQPSRKMKLKLSTIAPALLAVWLGTMVVLGWESYANGLTSPLLYFGGPAFTIVCITLLHFHLRNRERERAAKKRKDQQE